MNNMDQIHNSADLQRILDDSCIQILKSNEDSMARCFALALRYKKARTNLNAFVRNVIRDRGGKKLPVSSYQKILLATVDECRKHGKHFGHLAPPGIGKSTLIRSYLMDAIGKDQSLAICVISAELKIARRSVTLCRRIVQTPSYRAIYPKVIPDTTKDHKMRDAKMGWTMGEWFLYRKHAQTADPTMSADSVTPKAEGRRPDILFADDIMSRRVAESSAERENIIAAFNETWLDGRLSEGGWAIVIHNSWSQRDLLHLLVNDERFCSLWVGVNDDCESLFCKLYNPPETLDVIRNPSEYNAIEVSSKGNAYYEYKIPLPQNRETWKSERLLKRKKAAPHIHRKLFELTVQAPEDCLFPHFASRSIVGRTPAEILGCESAADDIPIFSNILYGRYLIFGGFDWSGAKRRGKSLTFIAYDIVRHTYLIVFHGRIKTGETGRMQTIVNTLDNIWNIGFHWQLINAEGNAIQDELNDAIIAMGSKSRWVTTFLDFTTGANKMDPSIGLPYIDVLLEKGLLIIPSGMAKKYPDWALLERNLETMCIEGDSPDDVMSLWFAVRGLDRSKKPTGGVQEIYGAKPFGGISNSGVNF
jgi:hypothetical protein